MQAKENIQMHRTSTLLRALRIVSSFGRPCSGREFAEFAWPQSEGFTKPAKRPGAKAGAVMSSAGAAYLGRLASDNLLVRRLRGFCLSPAGIDFLAREGVPVPFSERCVPRHVSPTVYWTGEGYIVWDGTAWTRWNW